MHASSLRARWRSWLVAVAIGAGAAAGGALILAPSASALAGAGPWPPLHARCVGVMALSLALSLRLAQRALDPAALRVPLLALAVWGLGGAFAALVAGTAAPTHLAALVAAGTAAALLSRVDDDPAAPSQHADLLLRLWSTLGAGLALVILALPTAAALRWPWRLAPGWVVHYAPIVAAWSVASALAARERRRYVRAPVLWGLMAWAAGTLAVSLWHAGALRWGGAATASWTAGLAGVALSAAQRLGLLRPSTWQPGRWPRDDGTAPPPQ